VLVCCVNASSLCGQSGRIWTVPPGHLIQPAQAFQARDPFIKQQLIDIAQKWHTMAAYEDKCGR
jgi:hypothetical protein